MSKLSDEIRYIIVLNLANARDVSPSLVAETIYMATPDSELGRKCHSAKEALKDASKTSTAIESLEQVRQWIVAASTTEIDAIIKEIKEYKA